ncbi:microcompartments protein [Thalassoporum mexicanum PCC 7367]|uniref:carbon dioxide-concentrating mechanism protein CcmK n=1 Tax=Thalassoporum mexicanum TaxID=3457544 RepID=UPI00029FB318|nr:BMC domain-containing protein [Pseudanabaena sp. PCC 7367]AFY69883.1 microcompartments protein [Pseudanabaena sp. PCC 7367]
MHQLKPQSQQHRQIQPRSPDHQNNKAARLIEQLDKLSESAVGLVSTRSFPAVVGTADMMLKASGVLLVGYEKIGQGYCTAVVRGRIADVRIAVQAGIETAEKFEQLVSATVIPRPMPNLESVLPFGSKIAKQFLQDRLTQRSRLSNMSIGLIETRGFPAMVGAADAMLKSADVHLGAYESIGAGLCTAIIRGNVADVAIAIEAGMHEAERIGELNAVMVIPRPLDDLEMTLPTAQYWLEEIPQPVPLKIPLQVKKQQKELVELPELQLQEQRDLIELPTESPPEPELLELPDLKWLDDRQDTDK